jgi:hypothetical protein
MGKIICRTDAAPKKRMLFSGLPARLVKVSADALGEFALAIKAVAR